MPSNLSTEVDLQILQDHDLMSFTITTDRSHIHNVKQISNVKQK